jgi:hypothetical protein
MWMWRHVWLVFSPQEAAKAMQSTLQSGTRMVHSDSFSALPKPSPANTINNFAVQKALINKHTPHTRIRFIALPPASLPLFKSGITKGFQPATGAVFHQ